MKIFPEQLRWFNEKELRDWLEGKRDCSDTAYESLIIQHLIDDLDEMHDAEHTIEVHVKIGSPTLEEATRAIEYTTNAVEKKINHTCINCRYYEPDVEYCEKLESDNMKYNYGCGYWKESRDEDL